MIFGKTELNKLLTRSLRPKAGSKWPTAETRALTALGAIHEKKQTQTYDDGLGGGGWVGDGSVAADFGGIEEATTTQENIPVGTQAVNIFNTQLKRLIWRGMSSGTLSAKPDNNERNWRKTRRKCSRSSR